MVQYYLLFPVLGYGRWAEGGGEKMHKLRVFGTGRELTAAAAGIEQQEQKKLFCVWNIFVFS